ncbi:MAG: pilus assembly protein PilP [Nitrospirae bacterium YQR-1]
MVLAALFASEGALFAENPPEEVPPAPVARIPKPVIYPYNAMGRRDPFMSIIDLNKRKRTETKEGKKRRVLSPLELVDLGSIQLSGILSDPQGKYALVTITGGKSFVIREGTPIGPNGGIVSKINSDNFIITEESTDPYGKPVPITTKIRLRKEEEE